MRVIEHVVEVPMKGSSSYKANLYGCGDWHLGTRNCAEDMLDRTLKAIQDDPNGLFIGMGYAIEAIFPVDPRFDARNVAPRYLAGLDNIADMQYMDVKRKLAPLAKQGKIIGLLDGNHEDNVRRRYYRNITMDLCRELNVKYLSYSSFIRLTFRIKKPPNAKGKQSGATYIVSAAHGMGGGRKKGSHINRINDMLAWADFDIALRGHVHRIIVDTTTRLKVTRAGGVPSLYQDTPVLGYTGCYFRSYIDGQDCYAERAEYPPSDLGCVVVHIEPFKQQTVGEVDNQKRITAGKLSIERFSP